jgi:uncharacterized protein YjbI with pentapeptide repeats
MAIKLKHTTQQVEALDANLSGSTFTDVNLAGAAFTNVNLSGLTIEDANMTGVKLIDARVDGMTINGILVSEMMSAYRAAKA